MRVAPEAEGSCGSSIKSALNRDPARKRCNGFDIHCDIGSGRGPNQRRSGPQRRDRSFSHINNLMGILAGVPIACRSTRREQWEDQGAPACRLPPRCLPLCERHGITLISGIEACTHAVEQPSDTAAKPPCRSDNHCSPARLRERVAAHSSRSLNPPPRQ